jgi:hypothetical protein
MQGLQYCFRDHPQISNGLGVTSPQSQVHETRIAFDLAKIPKSPKQHSFLL